MARLHLNTTPPGPDKRPLPCLRDLAELTRDHLPEQLVKLVPLAELARRAAELTLTHPRFREELPVVLGFEAQRRQRLRNGGLHVAGRPAAVPPAYSLSLQA